MIINETHLVLACIYQYVGADPVDDTWNACTVVIYFRDCTFRENLSLGSGIVKLVTDVFSGSGAVIMVQYTLYIYPLPDC